MRLRLNIKRHSLPATKSLFSIDTNIDPPPTIAQLLEQVTKVVPLEAEHWGLEDYVVTIGGYECLHYSKVVDVVKEDDELHIRPVSTTEVRARTLSGRHQINASGQHLVDGIPFGRPYLRSPNRPPIHIPPKKKRRVTSGEEDTELLGYDSPSGLLEAGSARQTEGATRTAAAPINGGGIEDESSEEDDSDWAPEDGEDGDLESLESVERDAGSPEYGLTENTLRLHHDKKRKRSVSFNKVVDVEHDTRATLTGSSSSGDESDDSDESEDESLESEISSSDTSSSDEGDSDDSDTDSEDDKPTTNGNRRDQSNDNTSEEGSSGSSSEKQLKTESQRSRTTSVPPGQGKVETRKRNARRRQKKRLDGLIRTGQLPVEATFADLKQYQTQSEMGDSRISKGDLDLETQRQRLLEQLQNGGIEVNPARSPQLVEEIAESLEPANEPPNESPEDMKQESPSNRPRLNLAGSNRLIFGSLGVRTPKSKEEGEKVRVKLASRSSLPGVALQNTDAANDIMAEPRPESAAEIGAWKKKLSLKAVECADEGVVLSQPPYPFVQCWDEQYAWNRPSETGKKRKRKKGKEQQQQRTKTTANEDYMSDHHDPEAAEFPPLPRQPDQIPEIGASECSSGSFIVFKELHMDASTKWQPEISSWQVARVDDNLGNEGLAVTIAPEYRRVDEVKYDDEGRRMHEGFEMPDSDDVDELKVDDGVRMIPLEQFCEVRILEAGEVADQRMQDKTGDSSEAASPVPNELDASLSNRANGIVPTPDDSDIEWRGIGDEAEDDSVSQETPYVTTASATAIGSSKVLVEDSVLEVRDWDEAPFSTAPEAQTQLNGVDGHFVESPA